MKVDNYSKENRKPMKKRRKVLAALISLLALAASRRIVYVSGFLTHKHPVRNTHVFTKKNNPSS